MANNMLRINRSAVKTLRIVGTSHKRSFNTPSTVLSQQHKEEPLISEIDTHDHAKKIDYYITESRGKLNFKESARTHDPAHAPPPRSRLMNALRRTFLPIDYPASVTQGYARYMSWQFVQNCVGSAQWVLTTNALLAGVGLTQGLGGLPWAAATTWVLKDGLGALGIIWSANLLGHWFDADTKRALWRADLMHNTGSVLELLTPLFPQFFLPLSSVANLIKGVSALTSGACRAAVYKSFVLRENLAEVTAKAHTQGTCAYVTGMSLGIGLSALVQTGTALVWPVFAVLAGTHLFCSYRKVSSVVLRTLNQQRTSLVLDQYFALHTVPTPDDVYHLERVIRSPLCKDRPEIVLGQSIRSCFSEQTELHRTVHQFRDEQYLITCAEEQIHVVLHAHITATHELRAYFNAYHLRHLMRTEPDTAVHELIARSLSYTRQHFTEFVQSLVNQGWHVTDVVFTPRHYRATWSSAVSSEH